MHKKFTGTGVAIITPFHKEGNIDFKSFEKIIEYQITNNVDYIVFLGTTGESAVINNDERNAIINFAIEICDKRVPVVVGIGGNNTQQVVNVIKETDLSGADAILSVSPYYNKPQQKGIFSHYQVIAGVSPLPIIIYNVPGRTGSNIEAETTLKLAREVSNIIAVKEASCDIQQISKIISEKPDDFLVISGDDLFTLPLLAMGGNGVISVVANVFPAEFSAMVKQGLNGEFAKARKIHLAIAEIVKLLFADGSPSGIKAALEIKDICKNYLRMPLVPVCDSIYDQLKVEIEKFEKSNLDCSY